MCTRGTALFVDQTRFYPCIGLLMKIGNTNFLLAYMYLICL